MTPLGLRSVLASHYPVVRSMIDDTSIRFIPRRVDMRWYYRKAVPICVTGFNPFRNGIFYGQHSFLAEIISSSNAPIRKDLDWYLYELFFAAHDYVHVWCVQELTRELGAFEDAAMLRDRNQQRRFIYTLLLSEAAATIAIDYWLLCQRPVSRILPRRPTFSALTTSFTHRDAARLRKIDAKMDVASKSFFDWLATAYFTGRFDGPSGSWGRLSGMQIDWVSAERVQANKQRRIATAWLSYLVGSRVVDDSLYRGMSEYADLTRHIAEELWRCCFAGKQLKTRNKGEVNTVFSQPKTNIDFRFVNVRDVDDLRRHVMKLSDPVQRRYFVSQYVSCFDYNDISRKEILALTPASSLRTVERATRCRIGSFLSGENQFHLAIPN
jgi:hypothetical protein